MIRDLWETLCCKVEDGWTSLNEGLRRFWEFFKIFTALAIWTLIPLALLALVLLSDAERRSKAEDEQFCATHDEPTLCKNP